MGSRLKLAAVCRTPAGWRMMASAFMLLLLGTSYAQPLRFQAATPSLEALPRETVNLALQLENTGNAPWRGTPELKLPKGWRTVLEPGDVALEPGEHYLALFTVLVSASAEAGEYTLPVTYTTPAGTEFRASYTVGVQVIRALETVLLEAPSYMVAAPYTVRFSLRNAGNRPEAINLQARDNLSLPLKVRPAQVRLAPGAEAEVTVMADVAADLTQAQHHFLYLEATVRDDAEVASSAGASVELIPRSLSEASAYHLFPLKVRLSETLRAGPQAAPDYLGGLNLSVSGAGQLWDEDPGTLDLQLSLGSSRTEDQSFVRYENPTFRVAAGQQSLSLSPLTASRNGLGLSIQHDFTFGDDEHLEVQAVAYNATADVGGGLRTAAAFGSQLELGIYSLVSGGPYGAVLGGEVKLHPELAGLTRLNLETEYGFQIDTGERGFRLGGEVAAGGNAVSARWQQAQAGFQGATADSYAFNLSSAFQLDEVSSTYASATFNQKGSYRPGELLIASPEKLERSWAGGLTTVTDSANWSLRYEDEVDFGELGTSLRTKKDLTFGLSFTLSDDILFTQELSWLQNFSSTARDEALGYELAAFFLVEPSSLIVRAGGDYSLLEGGLNKVSLGLGWSGLINATDGLVLDLEGDLELLGDHSAGLSATGTYGFEDGQALDLDVSGRTHLDREPHLEVSLGYDVPLDVPLGRLSSVGAVTGTFENEAGVGISGLVVQLGGLAVITQADGSFTFPAVPEGDHILVLNAAAMKPDTLTVPALPFKIDVRAGETVVATFQMVRPAAVRGQVRFSRTANRAANDPIAGPGNAIIFGEGRPEQEAGQVEKLVVELRNGDNTLRARTDAEGRFQFELLPPGKWQLTVLRGSLSELYRLEPESQVLTVAPGAIVRVEVRLEPVARSIQFRDGGRLSTP